MQIQIISKDEFLKKVKPLDCFFIHGNSPFNKITDLLQSNITNDSSEVKVSHTGIILNNSMIERDVFKNTISKKSNYSITNAYQPFALHMSIPGDQLFWNAIKTLIPFYGIPKQQSDALSVDEIKTVLNSIENSDVLFYWVPLKNDVTGNENVKIRLNQFLRDHPYIPYEQNIADVLHTISGMFGFFKKWFGNKKNMTCSELVVRIYQFIGIMPKDIDPNTVYPSELLYKNHSDDEKMKNMDDIFGNIIYKVV